MVFLCQRVLQEPSLVWKVIRINRILPQDLIKWNGVSQSCLHTPIKSGLDKSCLHTRPIKSGLGKSCLHTRPINSKLDKSCLHTKPIKSGLDKSCLHTKPINSGLDNHKLSSLHFIKNISFCKSIRNLVSVQTQVFNIRGFSALSCNKSYLEKYWVRYVQLRLVSRGTQDAASYKRRTALTYIMAGCVFMVGASYAGVPLYRMFCQATGLGGQAGLETKGHNTSKIETMQKVKDRVIKVRFNADVSASMRWNFKPQQYEIQVIPGETALAFYTATNPTDRPIVGISTYNILPFDAGQYFNKIQCFCFEEQRLNPHEQVDMPVFFYIDPDYAEDPRLENVDTIFLSYTFFEAKEGLNLPLPGYQSS